MFFGLRESNMFLNEVCAVPTYSNANNAVNCRLSLTL